MSKASEWAEISQRKPPEFRREYAAETFVAKVDSHGRLVCNAVPLRPEDAGPFADFIKDTFEEQR